MNRARILKLLENVLGPYEQDGNEYNFRCPFCAGRGADHIGTLHVNLNKNASLCHTCLAASRNVLNVIRDVTGYMPHDKDAEKEIALVTTNKKKFLKAVKRKLWPKEKEAAIVPPPLEFKRLHCPPASALDRIYYAYARYRGLTDEQIDDYGIGYCSSGLYGGYLIFPFFQNGFSVYFSSRLVISSSDKVKVRNPEEDRRFYIYNYDRAMRHRHIILVEGVIDSITTGANAAAIMGKTVTDEQIALLQRRDLDEVTVMLDSDAHDAVIDSCVKLKDALESKVNYVLLEHGDPADNRHKIDKIIAKRKEFTFGRRIRFKLEKDALKREKKIGDSQNFSARIKEKLWRRNQNLPNSASRCATA